MSVDLTFSEIVDKLNENLYTSYVDAASMMHWRVGLCLIVNMLILGSGVATLLQALRVSDWYAVIFSKFHYANNHWYMCPFLSTMLYIRNVPAWNIQ